MRVNVTDRIAFNDIPYGGVFVMPGQPRKPYMRLEPGAGFTAVNLEEGVLVQLPLSLPVESRPEARITV